jgi:hypothetical protein
MYKFTSKKVERDKTDEMREMLELKLTLNDPEMREIVNEIDPKFLSQLSEGHVEYSRVQQRELADHL